MRNRLFMSVICFIGTVFIALVPLSAFAHFHYELPITSALQVNDSKELTSMKISWTYDNEITELMLTDQKDMKKLGEKLLNDLEKLDYFTFLKLNGKSIDTGKVESFTVEEIKFKDYSNLKLTFTLPLQAPVSLQGKNTLAIRHEDATASAIIYYDKPENLSIDANLSKNCKGDIKEKKNFVEGESPQIVQVICKA